MGRGDEFYCTLGRGHNSLSGGVNIPFSSECVCVCLCVCVCVRERERERE